MGNLLDYLAWRGDLIFDRAPFSPVDGLILSALSYIHFDGLIPEQAERSVPLAQAAKDYLALSPTLRGRSRCEKDLSLLQTLASSTRFARLELCARADRFVPREETQFAALTVLLGDGSAFLAFRGTDGTLVGWKEDFNLSFMDVVPAQLEAAEYIRDFAAFFPGLLRLGGHSKGGNLAVYSAMNCQPRIQDRIIRVYSMDGPGFRPEVMERCNYAMIADRVSKILPKSSLVGMIFEFDMSFQVVESKTIGLAQHDPYTWLVEDNHLKRAKGVYERRKRMGNALNTWMLSLDEERLKIFVDTLYQVISASQADDLIQFTAEWKRSMNGIVTALKEVDDETRNILKEVVKALFDIAGEQMKVEVTHSIHSEKKKSGKQSKPKLSLLRS